MKDRLVFFLCFLRRYGLYGVVTKLVRRKVRV